MPFRRLLAIAGCSAAGVVALAAAHALPLPPRAMAQGAGAGADLVPVDAQSGRARAVAALDAATVVAAVGGRVEVLDVTGPTGPRLRGRTAPLPGAPLGVAAGGSPPAGAGATVLAALGPHGLAVIDARDPQRPRVTVRLCVAAAAPALPLAPPPPRPPLTGCDDGGARRSVRSVALSADGTIGVAAVDSAVVVIDVAGPDAIRSAAWVDVGAQVSTVAVEGELALALTHPLGGDDAGNQVVAIDVRAPAEPYARGRLKLGGEPWAFVALAAAGRTAVAGGAQGGAVLDLRAADRPRLLARIDRVIEAVAVGRAGGRPVAALALARPVEATTGEPIMVYDDIVVLDLSAPRGPRSWSQHVAHLDRGPTGIALAPPDAGDGWLAVATRLGGVEAFTATAAGALPRRGTRTTGLAMRVALDAAGRALVVEGGEHEGGRARLAVYAPGTATAIGVIDGLVQPRDVAVAGPRAYVVEAGGVRTVALDDAAPRTIGFWSTGQPPAELAAGAGWLAVGDGAGTVQIVDPLQPDAWRPLSALPALDRFAPADLAAAGDRLYVAADDRLEVFDLADPRAPRSLGQVAHGTDPQTAFERPRLAVADGRLWLGDPSGGVVGYDVRGGQPRLLSRQRGLRARAITAVGDRAYVAVLPDTPAATADGAAPDGDAVAVVTAPFGGAGRVDTWRTPGRVVDLAAGGAAGDGLVIANADYGATRWLPRAAVTATATATAAATAPPRPPRTTVPADPARPHRAFLPVVVRAAGGAAAAPGALALRRFVGGTAASVAVDGPHGFVAEGQSITVLRILSPEPGFDGPAAVAELAVGQPVRSLAAAGGRLAALLGPAVAVANTDAFVLHGGAAAVQLVDTGDPARPRLAKRIALDGPAVDVAAGAGASDGHFAVVGVADGQGYFALIDARDIDRATAATVPLALGADAVPIGVALDGPRAVVAVARGADTVLVRIDVADPARPVVGRTLAGLGLAVGPGTVAMRGGPAFLATDRGLQVVDATRPDLVRIGQTDGSPISRPLRHIAAHGTNAWVLANDGAVLQVVERDGNVISVSFAGAQHVDHGGLGRALAAGPDAVLAAGGAVGGATVLGMPAIDFAGNRFGSGGVDRAMVGQRVGVGQVLAVAAGAADPDALPIAYAAMVDGRLQPLGLAADGAVTLGFAVTGRLEPPPLPLDDAAALGDLGVAVGPLTPLRAFTLLGGLSVSLGEAVPPFSARPLDQLRAVPSRRRVAVADDFAWVAERQAGVAVFDLADTERLTSVGRVETPGQPRDLAVRGGWAFVADGTAGLTVVDARNPASPSEAGHLALPGVAGGVALADDGRTAYVGVEAADGAWLGGGRDRAALWAVDVTRPAEPRARDTVGLGLATVTAMAGRGRWLYVAGAADDGGGAVAAVDVAVAARPAVVAVWRAGPGSAVPRGVAVVGPHVVAALGEGGMAVLAARP